MPITSSAKKALRQDQKRNFINQKTKSKFKKAVKDIKLSPDLNTLPATYSAIDRAVKKNLIHKNKAARIKSSLAKLVNDKASSAKPTSQPKKSKSTKKPLKKSPIKKSTTK